MAPHDSSDEKFGEKRPAKPRTDEWGNHYRTMVLHTIKAEKKCTDECKDHVTMTYSIEMDVAAVDGMQAFVLMTQGQEIPTKRDWVPVTRVLNSYN